MENVKPNGKTLADGLIAVTGGFRQVTNLDTRETAVVCLHVAQVREWRGSLERFDLHEDIAAEFRKGKSEKMNSWKGHILMCKPCARKADAFLEGIGFNFVDLGSTTKH